MLVHPSNSSDAKPAPIVVALHGYGGSGFELELISKLSDAADERGWFAVYPQGTGVPQAWSDGPTDDLAFLRQLVEDLAKGGCGDPARVIVTGISQGGWLSDVAGCEMSDLVAGVVAVAGRDMGWPCTPTRPVGFAAINGVLDNVLPFASGAVNVAAPVTEIQSVETWAAERAQLRSCQGEPSTTRQSPHVVAYEWSGCRAPMWLYRVEDGGHSWPGGSGIVNVDKELSVTDVIAAMLQAVS